MIFAVLNYLLRFTKKPGRSLGFTAVHRANEVSVHTLQQGACCVGVSEAAGTDFIQQQGEVKYASKPPSSLS